MVKDFESRIVPASAQSCHVEHVTNWQLTTVDAAMSFEPATVEVIRGETDEGGDLLAAHLAELPGSLSEFTAIRRASSRVSSFAEGVAGPINRVYWCRLFGRPHDEL